MERRDLNRHWTGWRSIQSSTEESFQHSFPRPCEQCQLSEVKITVIKIRRTAGERKRPRRSGSDGEMPLCLGKGRSRGMRPGCLYLYTVSHFHLHEQARFPGYSSATAPLRLRNRAPVDPE